MHQWLPALHEAERDDGASQVRQTAIHAGRCAGQHKSLQVGTVKQMMVSVQSGTLSL